MKYYSEDHDWVEINGDEATIGLSAYAVEELGEITYVGLPVEDEDFIVGDILGEVETSNGATEIYSPISGVVVQVNEVLEMEPDLINDSPEEHGWICKMTEIDLSELDDMMNETAYLKYLRRLKGKK